MLRYVLLSSSLQTSSSIAIPHHLDNPVFKLIKTLKNLDDLNLKNDKNLS